MAALKIDAAALLPPRDRIIREVLAIVLISVAGGPLLGYSLSAPVGLSVLAVMTWSLSTLFVLSFFYASWFFYRLWRAFREQQSAHEMAEFRRAIEGEDRRGN